MDPIQEISILLKLHVPDFYNNIFIPHSFFKNNNYDIMTTIQENNDSIFYVEKYIQPEEIQRFNYVFEQYAIILSRNFTTDDNLIKFLRKWTCQNISPWRANKKQTRLKKLLNNPKIYYFSPHYIIKLYCDNYYSVHDINTAITNTKKKLYSIAAHIAQETRSFQQKYQNLINHFVYQNEYQDMDYSQKTQILMQDIMKLILDLSEKLIKYDIYAINSLISNIINCYTPINCLNNNDDIYII